MADDRHVVRHPVPHLFGDHVRVFGTRQPGQPGELHLPFLLRPGEGAVARREARPPVAAVADHRRPADLPRVQTGDERVRPEPVRAVVQVVHLACRIEAGDVGRLVARRSFVQRAVARIRGIVHPEPAHRVVHAGKDLHRDLARVLAHELLVDLEDAPELDVELLPRNVRQVQVDLPFSADSVPHQADLEDLARRDVPGHEVPVRRVLLLQEVPALAFRDRLRGALVAARAWHPNASPFAARGLRHQAELVGCGDGGRMDLDELAVRVPRPLLVRRGCRRSGVDDRVRGTAEDDAGAARGEHHGHRRERLDAHRHAVERHDPAAVSVGVAHEPQELPHLVLVDEPFHLEAADLLVERVQELLAGRRAREGGAVELRASEAAEVEQSLGRAVEHDPHTVEQVDDAGRRVAHRWSARKSPP